MTLITNELTVLDNLKNSYWICAADRRLTIKGKFHSNRKKIFPIKYLKATVSYFGLAEFSFGGKQVFFADYIPRFISNNSDCRTLTDFANRLRNDLNTKVPGHLLSKYASGFHFSGFNEEKNPHFLHFSNVTEMDEFEYKGLLPNYKEPYADFLDEHAVAAGWDRVDPNSLSNKTQLYRNGDIRTHVLVWNRFNSFMKDVLDLSDFNKVKGYKAHADYVKFQFSFIASLYKKWSTQEVIGTPIDVFIILPNQILCFSKGKWTPLS